jgi:hypothetical protein
VRTELESREDRKKYLQRKHPKFLHSCDEEKTIIRDNQLDNKRPQTLQEGEQEGIEWKRRRPGDPFDQEVFRKLLSLAVFSSNSAQSIVENKEWRDVFGYLGPEVEMVSWCTLHQDIIVLFDNTRAAEC